MAAFKLACDDLRAGVIELGWMTSKGLAGWRDVMTSRRQDITRGLPATLGQLCTTDAIIGATFTIAQHQWCRWCDMRADDHLCCEDTFDWRAPDRAIG